MFSVINCSSTIFGELLRFIYSSSTLVVAFLPLSNYSRPDYYLDAVDPYERSGGRRSSLYDGENDHRDLAGDFNRSAYAFNTSRSV